MQLLLQIFSRIFYKLRKQQCVCMYVFRLIILKRYLESRCNRYNSRLNKRIFYCIKIVKRINNGSAKYCPGTSGSCLSNNWKQNLFFFPSRSNISRANCFNWISKDNHRYPLKCPSPGMFVQLRSIEFAFPLIKTRNEQSDLIVHEILDPNGRAGAKWSIYGTNCPDPGNLKFSSLWTSSLDYNEPSLN